MANRVCVGWVPCVDIAASDLVTEALSAWDADLVEDGSRWEVMVDASAGPVEIAELRGLVRGIVLASGRIGSE